MISGRKKNNKYSYGAYLSNIIWLKNCCKMNLNLSTTYTDVQRIYRLLTKRLNLSSRICSITICENFISLRYVAIQDMKIYTGNLFVLPELLLNLSKRYIFFTFVIFRRAEVKFIRQKSGLFRKTFVCYAKSM